MSTITKEFTKEQLISAANARMEFSEMMMAKDLLPLQIRNWSIEAELARIALASLEAEPVTEWTNEQCLEFLSIAFRHAEIKGDLELDDIRLGVKMVNGSRAAMLQGAAGNSPVIPDGWVACSERMPENKPGSYEYLVFEELNNGVHHDYWNVPDAGDDCQFTPFWNHYDRYVTHWQPLPSPPAK